jgi:hypothetical protein
MTSTTAPCLALMAALAAATAHAHHSISGVYDGSRQVTIDAVVIEFHFVNPHPFLTAEVKDGSSTATWRLEMDNRFELTAIGVTADAFKPGDRVIVSGSLGRRDPRALYIRRLERPADRFEYEQVGSSPRIRTTR